MRSVQDHHSPDPSRLAELGASLAARAYARRGVSQSNETIRIVLADDHGLVREGLRLLLHSAPDIVIIGEAGDGIEAGRVAQRTSPDVMVLDLDMPRLDGSATLVELKRSA